MIDLEAELKQMAEAYNIPEKQVATWWRSAVRQLWSSSPFKRQYEENTVKRITNTNPRTKKRYPIVKRFTCTDCGVDYGTGEMELDHISGENPMKDLSDTEQFFRSILLSKPEALQWMCGDKKKTVNKKKYVYAVGCHGLKTLMEMNPDMSKNEARAKKEFARLKKYDTVQKALKERGVALLPKFIKDQEALLLKLLMKEYEVKS